MISRFFPAKVKRLLGMRVKAPMPTYQLLDQPGQLEPLLKMPYYLSPGWLKIDPNFDALRKNPRFVKLVEGGS